MSSEQPNAIAFRVLAWALLIGSSILAFVAAIAVNDSERWASVILSSAPTGTLANWLLCFLTFSIALSVYILRGAYGGAWSVNPTLLLVVPVIAVGLLAFGTVGLAVLGGVAVIGATFVLQKRGRG